jgi:hypothetical protein
MEEADTQSHFYNLAVAQLEDYKYDRSQLYKSAGLEKSLRCSELSEGHGGVWVGLELQMQDKVFRIQ